MSENGNRCQKCNKKVGLWIGEPVRNDTCYCLSQQNASPNNNTWLCDKCYEASQNQYLKDYYNISKVEGGTTWIPVKQDGKVITYSYYKCLDCGNKQHPNDILGSAWCSKCSNSQGVEIFLGNDLSDEEQQGWHFKVRKCPTCHKDKGEIHAWPNNSLTVGKSKKEIEKMANKFSQGQNCECKQQEEPERERERESKPPQGSQGFNWKSPWVIGGGIAIVGIIGIIIYFLIKKNKASEEF